MKYLFGSLLVLISLGLFAQETKEIARPDLPGELMVDLGFSVWSETAGNLKQEIWPSKSVGIYYLKSKAISNKFRFNYGIGLSLDKIGFKTNVDSLTTSDYLRLATDTLGAVSFSSTVGSTGRVFYDKYSLKNTFLEIPFELRFHPQGTEEGEGFFVSLGGMVGVLLKSKDKSVFELNGEKYKSKSSGDLGVNNLRYGGQVRLGFRGIHLFYKHYFNNVFKDEMEVRNYDDSSGTFNPTMTTIGLNVTGF